MKKFRFLLPALSAALLLCAHTRAASPAGYVLSLEVSGFPENTRFYLVNIDAETLLDSASLVNGTLVFRGTAEAPFTARLQTVVGGDFKALVLDLENRSIRVKGTREDFAYARIEGSPLNVPRVKSRDVLRKWQTEREGVVAALIKIMNSGSGKDQERGKALSARMQAIDRATEACRIDFVRREEPSAFSLEELYFLRNTLSKDSVARLLSRFPAELRDNAYGRYLKSFLSVGQVPGVGDPFADIAGRAPDGKAHKLSDLRGKYVLLEFWASGCGPCRMENPGLVKLYRAYQPKGFEIYGFSLDKNPANWQKAIEKDGLPWTNVSDLAGQASPEATRYGVQALPQNFLIGPQGTILAVNLRGDALEKELAELLGKH